MKKFLVCLIFVIFLLGLTGIITASVETNYYIYEKKVLVEYNLDSISDLELRIPKDFTSLEINSEYELEDFGNYKLIKINSAENLSISYITQFMVDKSKDRYSFVSRNYLNKPQEIKLVLPESAVLLEEGIVSPEPDSTSSDGRSIILTWKNYNEKQIVVDYEFVKKNNFVFYIIILIIILFFIGYLIFQRKIFKKRIEKIKNKVRKRKRESKGEILKKDFTKNLYEDEKKIVEYLLEKKGNEAWTKEIFKDLGISKVKLSRKLRSLEQKELIKKIPYGNENKIRLLKK